jgi:hypothetical protein
MALRVALANLGAIPEPPRSLDATLSAPMSKVQSFAEHEQRLCSIVLAIPPQEEPPELHGLATVATLLGVVERLALLESLNRMGTAPDFLANGSLIVTVPSAGTAQDQVTRAARAALLVKDHWPSARISIATGRGVLQGRNAVGEVVDRAAQALTPLQSMSARCSTLHLAHASSMIWSRVGSSPVVSTSRIKTVFIVISFYRLVFDRGRLPGR